jgi:hypothetical protein
LYLSVAWSPCIGGSYGEHALRPVSNTKQRQSNLSAKMLDAERPGASGNFVTPRRPELSRH